MADCYGSVLAGIRKTVDGKLALLEQNEVNHRETLEKIEEARKKETIYKEATEKLNTLYEKAQERFHVQIQTIVTYCLKEVFGEDAYEFKIVFEKKRNHVEASLVFSRDGEDFNPLYAAGGGILSVACFALRLAVIYLTKNNIRPIMILDEPFSQLSVEYRDRMALLLNKLVDDFGFQFILITHASEFEIGHIYKFDSKHNVVFSGTNYGH